jgi:hypothetical protein
VAVAAAAAAAWAQIYHDQRGGYNNQMVALVDGSGNKVCSTKKGVVVGQRGRFWQLAT